MTALPFVESLAADANEPGDMAVSNGDFEDVGPALDISRYALKGWTIEGDASAVGAVSRKAYPELAMNSDYCLFLGVDLVGGRSTSGAAWQNLGQSEPGRYYTVTAKVKTLNGHAPGYKISLVDAATSSELAAITERCGDSRPAGEIAVIRFSYQETARRTLRIRLATNGTVATAGQALRIIIDNVAVTSRSEPPSAQPSPAIRQAGHLADDIVFAVRHRSRSYHWYDDLGWFSVDTKAKLYCAPGSQIQSLNPDTGKVRVLLNDSNGAFRDPQVHYDGKRMVFSWRREASEYYHLYELDFDGKEPRQLTDGPFDDIEPTYLPDGDLIFVSTRCNSWVCCGSFKVTTLHRCDGNGRNMRKLSSSALNENTPWVLPDGRVLYMRWEYVDRNQMRYQHLWTMHPDGTGVMVFYGNQFPGNVFLDGKPIPGTDQVMYVESAGHGQLDHAGVLMVVDPRCGPDDRASSRPLNLGPQFHPLQGNCFDPYPLAQDSLLFAHDRSILWSDGKGHSRRIYTLPADAPGGWIIQEPRPIRPRPRETIIPARTDSSQSTGQLVLADAAHGRNMKGVRPGEIKKLLVLEQLPKPISFQISWNQPISMGGTFTFKRILGTVPVEPDGSASLEVPALRNLFFVALDENDLSVKRMQSYVTLQPGEVTGCVGCHEHRTEAPRIGPGLGLLALRRPASPIQPIAGIPDIIDFPRHVQPILDRHCVACHDYEATAQGGPRAGGVILTGDHGPWFSHAYATLTLRKQFSDGRNDQGNRPPRTIGSSASPVMQMLDGKHYESRLTPLEKTLVRLWIETGAAYPGTYAAGGTGMIDLPGRWGTPTNLHPIDGSVCVRVPPPEAILERRCTTCHRQQPLDSELLYNLSRPKNSMLLLAPLAKEHGGYGLCKPVVFAAATDPDYQGILSGIRAAGDKLQQIKRFDMPGFRPHPGYVREMKNYGILRPDLDPAKDHLDVYQCDQDYWKSLWHRP